MCNIHKKTKRKSVTIYKLVYKINDKYYGYYSGTEVKVGRVIKQTEEDYSKIVRRFRLNVVLYSYRNYHYNSAMVGKCCGFAKLSAASSLFLSVPNIPQTTILKITLGGDIMSGDAIGISLSVNSNEVVYAGTEILNIKEVK